MFRRSVLFKAVAVLMAIALLLPCLSAVSARGVQPEDEEPVYDMMGYARIADPNSTEWTLRGYKFNSLDPTEWEFIEGLEYNFNSSDIQTVPSSIAHIGDSIYMTPYDNACAGCLYEYSSDMELISTKPMSTEDTNDPLSVYCMNYSELNDECYVVYTTGANGITWGIGTLDLETGLVKPAFFWDLYGNEALWSFWPVAAAPMGTDSHLVIEAWTNTLYRVDEENYLSPEPIAELPYYASLFYWGSPEQFMPQDLYYDEATNTAYWCSGNAGDFMTYLVKIDVATGEVIYAMDMQAEGMPLEAPEGVWANINYFPIIGLDKYGDSEPGILGDADGSGNVDVTDALLVLRYAMNVITELPRAELADVDNSGSIDVNDALMIMRSAMGLIEL